MSLNIQPFLFDKRLNNKLCQTLILNLILIKPGLTNDASKTSSCSLNFSTIISAISIGIFLGVPIEKIKNGVSDYISSNNRSQILKIKSNNIILDAYNANPSSMLLAIKAFQNAELENKVLILGDMFELGRDENKFHQEIVDYCNNLDIERVFLVGEIFSKTNYSNKFISSHNYIELSNNKEFKEIKHSSLLIKGSRGVELEKILDYIS